MSATDGSNSTGGGGAPGPGGGSGAGPGGGPTSTTPSAEPKENVRTQLISHPNSASVINLQQSQSPSSTTTLTQTVTPSCSNKSSNTSSSTLTTSTLSLTPSCSYTSSTTCTTNLSINHPHLAHLLNAPIKFKNSTTSTNLYTLKTITQEKTKKLDPANRSSSAPKNSTQAQGGGGDDSGTTETIATSSENIKTQLIPHPNPASVKYLQQSHSPSPTTSIPTQRPSCSSYSSSTSRTTNLSITHPNIARLLSAPIKLKNPKNVTNLFSLNTAKIMQVKTTTLVDAANSSGLTQNSLTQAQSGGAHNSGATGTLLTSGGLSVGAIKVGNSGTVATSLSGNPIALNTSQTNTAGATSIRAIGASGQSTQVRVVMGNLMTPSMIKQLENAGSGRTQITAFPTAPARSVSNTSITVTRTATQATYMPRANVTATQMTGVGVGVPAGQRLVAPIRTTTASVTATGAGATVTGISAGNFVRSSTVSRNTSSPATTVISPSTSTTWMAANPTGQMQLIRTIPHQSRQRIITTQGISGLPVSASGSVASVGGSVVTSSATLQSAGIAVPGQQANNTQQNQGQSTIQAVSSAATQQQQPTYVATVLPPRHQATLVYSSNVATSQPLPQQQQQFNQTSVAATGPRFAVASPLTGNIGTAGAPRQIRPIPFAKSFSAAKLNTTNISIRTPNLAPSIATGVSNANNISNSPRSTTVTGVSSTANVLPSTNLSAARIIQLQQQPGATAQQIIGTAGRLAANVMLQPIIVNASGTNKIGIRPPVTMAAKVQPSLTITQLGIGKLPSSASGGPASLSQQNLTGINTSTGNNSPSISAASITATNLSTNATTQLVNVSQGGQILTTQNIVTSSAGGTAAGGATVVPLTINTRGVGGGNIITGTMAPIKNANAITVAKVMTQAQLTSSAPLSVENMNSTNANNAVGSGNTNVFIHHAAAPQRSHSNSSASGINTSQSAVNVSNTGATNVLTSTGNVSTGAFLQPGSTIYYESMPASSVQVSTGVLSLTTTTLTSSTISQNQIASTAGNISISSLPFVTHSSGQPTTATFTVVPSTGGRTIGQLQIPVSSAGTQIQAVPVRFSQLNTSNLSTAAADAIAVSQSTPQLLQQTSASTVCVAAASGAGGLESSQIIIPASVSQQTSMAVNALNTQQTHQMVIPLQTSIKVTSGANTGNSSVISNFLRKLDAESSPVRAAKNLQPTLLSMGSSNMVSNSPPVPSSVGNSYSLTSVTSSGLNSTVVTLTADTLAKKERTSAVYTSSSPSTNLNIPVTTPNRIINRTSRADSPDSSDGSTTVSANSSPGVDQQIQDNNMIMNRLAGVGANADTHFNPIDEQHNLPDTPNTSRNSTAIDQHHHGGATSQPPITIQQRLNSGALECPPRKKSRRSTNDSQLSTRSQPSLSLPPPHANNCVATAATNPPSSQLTQESIDMDNIPSTSKAAAARRNEVASGKEPEPEPGAVDYYLKRPKKLTLLSTYQMTWNPTIYHFLRYSDVKVPKKKRPSITELANQANIFERISGWRMFYVKKQMLNLCSDETETYDELAKMLHALESSNDTYPEIEEACEALKSNMQRTKVVIDGVADSENQLMSIFKHQSYVAEIISKYKTKRNYKKRDKV